MEWKKHWAMVENNVRTEAWLTVCQSKIKYCS